MKTILSFMLHSIFFIAIAPLLSGIITKLKNNIRMRKGQSVFQPYYDLMKLFLKGEVIPGTASWIFRITPFIVIASSLAAAMFVPVFFAPDAAHRTGDFLALVFILAAGRFFLALSALDTGSSFGGMGSSREMFISSLVEPAACLAIFSLSLKLGSTDIALLAGPRSLSAASIIAGIAFFLIALAETSRVPVDNQETHLELTMVHEAMVLEYSGRSLALIEMASCIKQMIWFFIIAMVILPYPAFFAANAAIPALRAVWYSAGVLAVGAAVALVEVSVAKMRLFRVADYLSFAFALAIVATVCAVLGV